MSLSGSSASRKSIWAITRFASSSSMNVGRKMIRSLSRREKMSKARSPRGVCSITMGTRAIVPSFGRAGALLMDLRLADQVFEDHPLAEASTQHVEVAALLHHTPNRRGGALAGPGDLLHLGLEVGLAGGHSLLAGDGLQEEGPPHGPLGARPELPDQLGVVPLDDVGIHAL